MKNLTRLNDNVLFDIVYHDETKYGSVISGQMEKNIQLRTASLRQSLSSSSDSIDSMKIRKELLSPEIIGDFYQNVQKLKTEFLYPPINSVTPVAFSVIDQVNGTQTEIPLSQKLAKDLASWIGEWQKKAVRPNNIEAGNLFSALEACGAFSEATIEEQLKSDSITFVGHASVQVSSKSSSVLVDPFYLPAMPEDTYRPLSVNQLQANGIFITHSHPDHFHLGTLLRYGADVPIYVPKVTQESALSIDMHYRLQELGFRNVYCMEWGTKITLGDCVVSALPFYGEQPTTGDVLYPEIRNEGNLYYICNGDSKVLLTADSGQDHAGTTRQVAQQARQDHGPVDVVFGGFRTWSLYPYQYLGSSVSRYALFVPENEWGVRQCIMNNTDESLDVAEILGANKFVPYANGGAPWYWRRGLGPCSDVTDKGTEHFDPHPESVLCSASQRSSIGSTDVPSSVEPCIMRPGQYLYRLNNTLVLGELDGCHYSYTVHSSESSNNVPWTQQVAVARKKTLLMILAPYEFQRLGVNVSQTDAQELSNEIRKQLGLNTFEKMKQWMEDNDLDQKKYSLLMKNWAQVRFLETYYQNEIDKLVDAQLALQTMPFAVTETVNDSSPVWMQFNIGIHRPKVKRDYETLINKLIVILESAFTDLRVKNVVKCLFVQRKDPDIRLRLLTTTNEEHYVDQAINELLNNLIQKNIIKESFKSVYEPEYLAFGGFSASNAVHQYFDADTQFFSTWQQLSSKETVPYSNNILSMAQLNDLFLRTLNGGNEEVWDVWYKIARLHDIEFDNQGICIHPIVIANLRSSAHTESLNTFFPQIIEANKSLAEALQSVLQQGELCVGLRAILANIGMFHLNRYGIANDSRHKMIVGMLNAFNPHKDSTETSLSTEPVA